MHVALFTDCLDLVNGVCTTYNALIDYVQKTRPIDLTVFAPASANSVQKSDGATIVRLRPNLRIHPPDYREFQSGLISFRRIDAHLSTPPDLVHIATQGPFGMIGGLWARWRGIPDVGFYHTDIRQYGPLYGKNLLCLSWPGKILGQSLAWVMNRTAYGACSLMFVQTEHYIPEAESIANCPAVVIPTGIDTDLFSPPSPMDKHIGILRDAHLKDAQHLAIFVGRLAAEKNISDLVRAYPALKQAGIQLVLVGDGPLRRDIPASLPITGYLSGESLLDAYHSADFLILPSHTDTIGLVVLEAMACGLPVVCSPFGGPAEIVRATGAGAICDTADVPAFVKTCATLVADRAHWLALAGRARAFGQSCAHARSFSHMIEAYRQVLASAEHKTPLSLGFSRI